MPVLIIGSILPKSLFYYRLTQTDFDGQENYLAAITLHRNTGTVPEPLLHFTPNPAGRQVKVELYHLTPDTPNNARAVLLTPTGSQVWEQTVSLPEFTLDRTALPVGDTSYIYIIPIQSNFWLWVRFCFGEG